MGNNIFRGLVEQRIITPYLENAFNNDEWPDHYFVEIDSSPYYGLVDDEGVAHETGSGDGYFHPSTHATMTARRLYYSFHPEYAKLLHHEPWTFSQRMSVAIGTAMHAVVQTQLDMANLLVRGEPSDDWTVDPGRSHIRWRWPERNPFEFEYINDIHRCRGRADGVLDHPRLGQIIFEYKTMNSPKFRQLSKEKDEWYSQVQLAMDHYGCDEALILVQEMGLPWATKEYRVRKDRAHIDAIFAKWDYVRECVKRDMPPICEHPRFEPSTKRCAAAHLCHAF